MTLEEFVKNTLCKSGIQEATGVELTFADGRKLTIHSDNHPALKATVDEKAAPTVRAVQSAQGGM
jgi:hypothetical protein